MGFLLIGAFCKKVEIERKTGLNAAFLWDGSLSTGIRLYVLGRQKVCFWVEKAMFLELKVHIKSV